MSDPKPEISSEQGDLATGAIPPATSEWAAATAGVADVAHVEAVAVPAEGDGGPAAPLPSDMPMTGRQKFRLVGLVILKRVRFIAILAAVGMFIGYWDTVMNYWEKWTRPGHVASRELEPGHEFYCPMDPQVVRTTYEPNGDVPKCPICGMPLSVRKHGEAVKLPEGITGRVQLSPERIELAGIKTVAVDYRPMVATTKTVGYVAYDETRLSRIVSRVGGYVEKLYVDETFRVVHKGDPLAEIYSPELYTTAQELVLAEQSRSIKSLAASAREKLLLLGVSPQEIDEIVAAGRAAPRLVIRSPQEGYVVNKEVVVGASVEPKMTLFEVADLSTVWVEAEVYEKDIPLLRTGQNVEAAVEAYPNQTFAGKLALVYPQLDAATRTNRVRFVLDNPRHELRPGMFATVQIDTPLESIESFKIAARKPAPIVLTAAGGASALPPSEFLSVPERAVIDTGAKKVVYVEREPGLFEGVEVELGPRHSGYYPVIKGLKPGDKVAAAGGFLIDAETRLNPAAAATYFGASGGPQTSGGASSMPSVGRPSSDAPLRHDEKPAAGRETRQPPAVEGPSGAPQEPRVAVAAFSDEERESIDQLPEADRPLALRQRVCPVTGAMLGSMGVPIKITLRGQTVFLCCHGCVGKAKRSPDETLKKLADAIPAGEPASSADGSTAAPAGRRQEP